MNMRKENRVATSFLLGLGLMLAGLAAQAQDMSGSYKRPCLIPEGCGYIEEEPVPVCPDIYIDCAPGYRVALDHRSCQARCVPSEGLDRIGAHLEGIEKAVGGGDMGKAAAGLDHLFTNSEGLKDAVGSDNGSAVVYAPAPSVNVPDVLRPQPEPCGDYVPCQPEVPPLASIDWRTEDAVPQPGLQVAHCGDSEGCHSEPGRFYEDVTTPIFREIERQVENHDYNKDAREEYGGCRMKGTCSKDDDKATR